MAGHRYQGRLHGLVLAVGEAPLLWRRGRCVGEDPLWPELEFGDLVELTQHGEERKGEMWCRNAVYALFGDPSPDATRTFAPEDGGPERYALTQRHYAAIIEPDKIVCRWARREWVFKECYPDAMPENPSPRPIGDRILIRNAKPPEKSAGGILLPHWMRRDEPIGEVVAVGRRVRNVTVGDWVLTKTDRGTRLEDRKGDVFTSLREGDVLGRWDEEPSEEEKLVFSAEIGGAR